MNTCRGATDDTLSLNMCNGATDVLKRIVIEFQCSCPKEVHGQALVLALQTVFFLKKIINDTCYIWMWFLSQKANNNTNIACSIRGMVGHQDQGRISRRNAKSIKSIIVWIRKIDNKSFLHKFSNLTMAVTINLQTY